MALIAGVNLLLLGCFDYSLVFFFLGTVADKEMRKLRGESVLEEQNQNEQGGGARVRRPALQVGYGQNDATVLLGSLGHIFIIKISSCVIAFACK